jgi:hypothetical protein
VAISEVYYHPPSPDGKTHEFIELFNDSAEEVSLAGWRLDGGVRFTFPAAARLPAGGFAVVCRDRAELIRGFSLRDDAVFGDYDGVLDNGGDAIVLVDAQNAFVDGVDFDDAAPWPEGADGDGASLQRLCASEPGWRVSNWTGTAGESPTPLARNVRVECPLPPLVPPPVVISEIHYHPAEERDASEEFIEVANRSGAPVDVGGWRFVGITFRIPDGTVLAPGEQLAICRNHQFIRDVYGVARAIGDFTGQLSNSGERLLLLDRAGTLVDYVRYRDEGDWPVAADQGGRSLEKPVLDAPGEDPASWSVSVLRPQGFKTLAIEGPLATLLRQRVVIGVNGAGEFIVDNIALERVGEPGVNLIPNGDFEAGIGEWLARGNAATSVVEDGIGVGGTRGMRVRGQSECAEECNGCASSQGVSLTLEGIDSTQLYRLSCQVQYVSGDIDFYCGMLRGVSICLGELLATPGERNSIDTAALPPFVATPRRFPIQPASDDRPFVSAQVRAPSGQALEAVELAWSAGTETGTIPMRDDGATGDHRAGDGVFGAQMPQFPHNTPVVFRITARTADGRVGVTPRTADLALLQRKELWGYYVNDNQVDSVLPVYQILLPEADATVPRDINTVLNCTVLRRCDFAFAGELYPDARIRFRGNTACVLEKRYLKLVFNRGRWFRGVRKLNLESLWTDKGLVREHLAWDFIRQLGVPYCETEFIRVHLNGLYHGLFLYLEHPDERFLERNGLSGDDCLYKAKQPTGVQGTPIGVDVQASPAAYGAFWEIETCKREDFTALADFVGALHADGRQVGGGTAEFHLTRTYPDWVIEYQVIQIALNNIDSFAKNHFLLWDRDADRWGLLTWDMDLTFGKHFDGRLNRPDPPRVGTINDCMLSPGNDLNPWFTTTVLGNQRLHWWVDFIFNADRDFFRRAYIVRLWDILQEKYSNAVYDPILDELESFLFDEQQEDFERWGRTPVTCLPDCRNCATRLDMRGNIETIKQQISLHRDFLISFIRRFHAEFTDHDSMKITEVMFNPVGVSEDLEYVELLNTSGRLIDISGWALTGGIAFVFPAGTLVPQNGAVIVAGSREVFVAQYPEISGRAQVVGDFAGNIGNDGDELRLVDAGPGYPATIDFLEFEDGGRWPDVREGHSIELSDSSRSSDNDDPRKWRMSDAPLGTPGVIPGVETRSFVRGDSNDDTRVNISDAVTVLLFLFGGGDPLPCADAGDADDDGRLMLTDALVVLDFLFRAGPPLPAPFPDAGFDPTPDGLTCD